MNKKSSHDANRFNSNTQAILIFAKTSARVRGQFLVDCNDLFLGILHMPHTDAAQALEECGITLKQCAQRWPMMPLMRIACECAYTPHVENILWDSIAHAAQERHTHVLPSDLLLAMLESLRGGDKEVDAIFEEDVNAIKIKLQTIKQKNQAGVAASAGEKI